MVTYTDNATAWKDEIFFNPSVYDWQFASGTFDLSDGTETVAEYDDKGNLVSYTDSKDNTTEYQYDSNSNLTKTTGATGLMQSVGYNSYGHSVSSVIENSGTGRILTESAYVGTPSGTVPPQQAHSTQATPMTVGATSYPLKTR